MNTLETVKTEAWDKNRSREFMLRGAGELIRGRLPFARAQITGDGEHGGVCGEVCFYYTPLGSLVCASLKGLERRGGIYLLTLSPEGAEAGGRCAIPPLYARDGYAWCSSLTEKLSVCDVLERPIFLYSLTREGERAQIARGVVAECRGRKEKLS